MQQNGMDLAASDMPSGCFSLSPGGGKERAEKQTPGGQRKGKNEERTPEGGRKGTNEE